MQHIYEFRSLIDGHAARLAATRASAAEMDDLTALHEALVDATERDDIDTYVLMDRLFYEVLANAAQNVYLAEVIPRIFNLHLRLWFFISKKAGGWHSIARSHEEMTRRGRRRDPAAQSERGRARDEGVHHPSTAGHARAVVTSRERAGGRAKFSVFRPSRQSRGSRRRSIRSTRVCMVAMALSRATKPGNFNDSRSEGIGEYFGPGLHETGHVGLEPAHVGFHASDIVRPGALPGLNGLEMLRQQLIGDLVARA